MRVKHVLARVPVPAKLRLFWDRVTISKITTIYFVFSVLHCLIQIVFQVQAFTINAKAATFLSSIIAQGNATGPGFAVLGGSNLEWCTSVPSTTDTSSCSVIWSDQGTANAVVAPGALSANDTVPSESAVPSIVVVYPPASTSAVASVVASSAAAATPSVLPSVAAVSSSTASASSVTVATPSLSASSSPAFSSAASSSASSSAVVSVAPSVAHLSSSAASTGTASVTEPSSVSSTSSTSAASSVASIQAPSSSVAVFTVTVAPSVFSHSGDTAAPSQSVTRTLTVALSSSAPTSTPVVAITEIEHLNKRVEVVGAISSSGSKEVQVYDFNGDKEVTLDEKCLMALNWPNSQVDNTKREDIVFICFQIWVLGMSVVALLNESIPHICASLLTHIVATAWGGFQVYNTKLFRADFVRLTTNGACGVNLLPTYWQERANAEIPSLGLNCVALLVSVFLSWRLIKLFGWQTFKRVGASLAINRIYNAVLVLSIVIQLSGFFIVVSGGLWIDQVFNGDIGRLTTRASFFKAIMVVVLVLLIPWLTTGWIAVRRELKVPMLVFLLFSLLYLVGWSAMFVSNTFRWTFLQWRFFSLMTSASVFLTTVTFIVGVICRVNFGKGLRRHLEAQELLVDDVPDYEKGNFEKVDFPSSTAPIPTFSATFGKGPEVPPPSQMFFAPRFAAALPPRFYGPITVDPNSAIAYGVSPLTPPSQPTPSHLSADSVDRGLIRHESGSSQHSVSSTSSTSSGGHSAESENSYRSKRWIIE
ncbi:hypothetical protein EUX98_g4461 [Antrodiella citrinella]|uniref:Uncharacterized protein n=1 Tax=Antrodiella citrinella TaxID=2447956 RepID=A0A4S4MTX0_9APHY|nr:hypothetical protein EUX98_g4461 [Antrodiella citrinella]